MRCIKLTTLCAVLLVSSVQLLANTQRTQQDLDQVQKELKQTADKLKQQQAELDQANKQLKEAEQLIASSTKELKQLKFNIELNRNEQKALRSKIAQLEQSKQQQQTALAAQLKSAYMSGNHDYTKLLLNQVKGSEVERTLNYYNYLNKARINKIETLKTTLLELAKSQSLLEAAKIQLDQLYLSQQLEQDRLVSAQSQQQALTKQLTKTLSSTQSQLAYLQENEQILKQTLDELSKNSLSQEIMMDGLAKLKGKLNWPSQGQIKHRFGTLKHGSFRWKGVLLNAKEGASVKSIADGQVLFADWLKGFGWVIIVDHGEDFMSLYGHNQALLKEVGDKIVQGEMIALVGQSGGQTNPSLYFEIRHKGLAVNPVKWCKRI